MWHDIPRTSKKIIVECDRKITTFPRFEESIPYNWKEKRARSEIPISEVTWLDYVIGNAKGISRAQNPIFKK